MSIKLSEQALLTLGEIYFALSDYERAKAIYQESFDISTHLSMSAQSAACLYQLGRIAQRQRKSAEATAYFEQSRTLDPEFRPPIEAVQPSAKAQADTAEPATNLSLDEPLNQRELEVLELIVSGLSNRKIAERLILAEGTVKWYTTKIYSKLDVQNRAQAVYRAQQLNLFG